MKQKILLIFFLLSSIIAYSQVNIQMEKNDNTFIIPCKLNGLPLNFIFDTGADNVSISLTEAMFMLKNGYISEKDLYGAEYYQFANGEIAEGTKILIRVIEIGGLYLYNVDASIVHELNAPLLLGQSAISKLGKIQIDYETNILTILNKKQEVYYSQVNDKSNNTKYDLHISKDKYKYTKLRNDEFTTCYIWRTPDFDTEVVYNVPKGETIYILLENVSSPLSAIFHYVYCNGYYGYLEDYNLTK